MSAGNANLSNVPPGFDETIAFHRFRAFSNGIGTVAGVEIAAQSAPAMPTVWMESASHYPLGKDWIAEGEEGVRDALAWHMAKGGGCAAFTVRKLIATYVDTWGGAIRCAATFAAWKSLGHAEFDLMTERTWTGWRVLLKSDSDGQTPGPKAP
ncbi:MAG: hypothetical protein QM783_15400 [Phycisphaerales bacterium]